MKTATATVKTPKAPKAPKGETVKTPKAETASKPASPLTFKAYKPEARAIVETIRKCAVSASRASEALVVALVDGLRMGLHAVTGHNDAGAWAYDLLTEAAPLAARSTVFGWIEQAHGRMGVADAGLDVSEFQTDALRLIGSRGLTGQDATRMRDLAKRLHGDESLRNRSGKVDAGKARKALKGSKPEATTPDAKAHNVAEYARKCGGSKAQALALLAAAAIIVQNQAE